MKSWKEYHHLTTAGEATETWTSPVALQHCAIGGVGVGLPEGGVDLPKEEAPHPAEKDIGARVQDVTGAGPEIDDTDLVLSPQVITEVTDIGAIQNLLKGLRKATRRAEEGMSSELSLVLVQMPRDYEDIYPCGRIKICFPGSFKSNLVFSYQVSLLFFLL